MEEGNLPPNDHRSPSPSTSQGNATCGTSFSSQAENQSASGSEVIGVSGSVALIDPLSLCPPEIAARIFYLACQPIPEDAEWRRKFYPLWLGHVSRRWRKFAWATSELWETIVLRVLPATYDVQSDLLQEWLERAQGRSIDIHLSVGNPRSRKIEDLTSAILTAYVRAPVQIIHQLQHHSEQWRHVNLQMPVPWNHDFYRPRDLTFTFPLPHLRSMEIAPQDLPRFYEELAVGFDFRHALALRKIAFTKANMVARSFDVYPTTQITSLVLKKIKDVDLLRLLDKFPKLQELELEKATYNYAPIETASHKRLTTLTVDAPTERDLFQFFACVSFPSLRKLKITLLAPFQLLRYQRRSFFGTWTGFSLTSLSIECQFNRKDYQLVSLLDWLPSLVEIYIHQIPSVSPGNKDPQDQVSPNEVNRGLGGTFFETLNPLKDPSYLPKLEILYYEGHLATKFIDFIEPLVIRARIRTPDPELSAKLESIAVLKSAKIKAEQRLDWLRIAEYDGPDALRMIEMGALTLVNLDGTVWK